MAKKPLPLQEVLRQFLRYDPETGKLFWMPREAAHFQTIDPRGPAWAANCWNARFAGKEAVKNLSRDGYGVLAVARQPFYAHRLIWKLVTGEEPDEIDHINGNRLDNRMSNIRSVQPISNSRNMKVRSDNTVGYPGITKLPNGRYLARVVVNGKRSSIGCFGSFDEARAAKQKMESQLGYHPNHGRA